MQTDIHIRESTDLIEVRERLSRWLKLRWPPGFMLPNCPCCSSSPSQTYHCMGGLTAGTPSTRRSTNYQYTIDTWTAKATMWAANEAMGGSTPTTTGSAYVYGGISSSSPFFLSRSDSYSPDTWSTNTAMSAARYANAGCAVSSLAYSFGGLNSSSADQSDNFQMTPGAPSTWATKTSMPDVRSRAGATYIGAKAYNLAGDKSAAQTSTNYEYDPSGNSWGTKTAVPTPAVDGMAVFTISGRAYVIDGGNTTLAQNNSYVVDTWTAKTAPPSSALRQYLAGASNDAGGIGYETGGLLHTGATVATHEEYVPDTWTSRANLPITIDDATGLYA